MARDNPDAERTKNIERVRSALTVAGLDPSGGAGITADLRGFRAASVWGASVCAVLTVQSTKGLVSAHPVPSEVVRSSAVQCLVDLDVRAMKSGALGSEENIRAVAALFAECRHIPSVVDPVMAPSRTHALAGSASITGASDGSSARLDGSASNDALWALVRAATLVTPNADEASALLGRTIRTEEEARAAAEDLVRAGARAVLLKGGHVESGDRSVDWFVTPRRVASIARKRRVSPPLHGTGCALSSLITGRLAATVTRTATAPKATLRRALSASKKREQGPPIVTDEEMLAAIVWARSALDRALRSPLAVGGGARVLDVRPRVTLEPPR